MTRRAKFTCTVVTILMAYIADTLLIFMFEHPAKEVLMPTQAVLAVIGICIWSWREPGRHALTHATRHQYQKQRDSAWVRDTITRWNEEGLTEAQQLTIANRMFKHN